MLTLSKGLYISGESDRRYLGLDWQKLAALLPVENLRNFFELEIPDAVLIGVSPHIHEESWRGISIGSDSLQIKIDRNLVLYLLSASLGHKDGDDNFSCVNLSEIEREMIQEVMLEMLARCKENLGEIENSSEKVILAYWLGRGMMLLSLPLKAVVEKFSRQSALQSLSASQMQDVALPVSLLVGKSKMTVSEMKNLYSGDCVLLEESSNTQMQLVGIKDLIFPVNFAKIDIIDLPLSRQQMTTDELPEALANFALEVQVEFRGVKMKLKELMSLQQGSVLEIDEIGSNNIFLVSQGKTIANGKLVMVGEKFAMLIDNLLLDGHENNSPAKVSIQEQQSPQAQISQPQQPQQPVQPTQPQTQPTTQQTTQKKEKEEELSDDDMEF